MEQLNDKKHFFTAGLLTVIVLLVICAIGSLIYYLSLPKKSWHFQSIDTMKYSRDLAREKLHDDNFNKNIEQQIKLISDAGATHVAIGTPYDDEFLPYLRRWVVAARKKNLKVWFRGNFSGWEGWFGYSKINREEHAKKLEQFISSNNELFRDGDVFSPCPECENGGPGDPRITKDVKGHRDFLVAEYNIAKKSFSKIQKKVFYNYNSMNFDVAKLIMDRDTTKKLGGIVAIDHYVKTPEQLNRDIELIAKQSGGSVVLGEFGAPIPDIHGVLSEEQQSEWIVNALELIAKNSHVVGLNYWVHMGGSTALWNPDISPRKAVISLTAYYNGK